MSDLPIRIEDLYAAGARPFMAPITAPVPDSMGDVVDFESPYAITAPWVDLGALTGPPQTSRNLTVNGFGVEQRTTDVIKRVQEVAHEFTCPLGEIRPDILKLIYQSPSVDTVVATGEQRVGFGAFEDLDQFRVGFIGRFAKSQGIVTETDGRTRGRYFGYFGYRAQLAADNVQSSWGKGQLASLNLNVELFPEPDASDDPAEQYGCWLFEPARTIA